MIGSSDGGHKTQRCPEFRLVGTEPEDAGTALAVIRAVPNPLQILHLASLGFSPSTGITSLGSPLLMQVWAMLHLGLIQPTLRSAQLPNFTQKGQMRVIPPEHQVWYVAGAQGMSHE